jgi:hypothetical protein
VTSAIITLASELTQIDFRSQARDLTYFGLGGIGVEALKKLADQGA